MRSQRGETLIEVLAAIAIMSTIVIAALSMTATMAATSASHNRSVAAGNAATTVAERIESLTYMHCVDPASLNTAAVTGALGSSEYTASISGVRYLKSADAAATTAEWVNRTTCLANRDGSGRDKGVQEVTIQVSSSDGKVRSRLVVQKRFSPLCSSVGGLVAPVQAGARC